MIVKDEEIVLKEFLNSVKDYVDEIVIVDTGSKDNTKSIALEFTLKIFDFEWSDDFSAARNFSISKATGEWILILDADEVISKDDLLKIKTIIEDDNYLGYRFIQETYHGDELVSTRGICRLFQNNKGIKFVYPIHETVRNSILKLNGKIGKTGIVIRNNAQYSKEKKDYYVSLINKKIKQFPNSNAVRELELQKAG